MANQDTKTACYAFPGSLWLEQRVDAERRFGSWRRYPLFKMDGNGESAKIVEPVEDPSPEQVRLAQEWGQLIR